jgi:hypothetical protein
VTRALRRVALLLGVGLLALVAIVIGSAEPPLPLREPGDRRVPFAVLGDSDSHGYADAIWHPVGEAARGGRYRPVTLQWTEALALLARETVDLGEFGVWGCRKTVAAVVEGFGLARRLPRKQDHRFNFAFAGAHCAELHDGPFRQVPRLLALMREDPEAWRRGAVVIRIGVVDLGSAEWGDRMANDPADARLVARIDACTDAISRAVVAIRAEHAETAIVLVGLFDNAEAPVYADRWRSAAAMRNRKLALDRFDDRLRAIAAQDERVSFFDDRAWFRERWGGRDADGVPHYRTVAIGAHVVEHRTGDDPCSTALQDGHAGLAVNLLWAQSLSRHLAGLGLAVTPISDEQVEREFAARYAALR